MAMKDLVGSATALIDAQLAAVEVGHARRQPLDLAQVVAGEHQRHAAPRKLRHQRFDFALGVRVQAGFEARCWATYTNLPLATRPATEDWSATEQLKNQLICALVKKVYGFFELGQGRWQFGSGRTEGAEELQLGRSYILPVWLAVPVVDASTISLQTTLISLPETRQIATTNGTTTDTP